MSTGEESAPVFVRAGKQQVVWGTADGMKLLDIVNPTDYREFAQNTMEDSRIPVWLVNAETDLENGGNMQFILSQAKANKIPGLSITSLKNTAHTNGDQGHPFVMKGVDSITGKTNGFLNVGPALGKVAAFFTAAASNGANDAYSTGLYNSYKGATVSEFVGNSTDASDFAGLNATGCNGAETSARCLYETANSASTNSGFTTNAMGSNNEVTNLIDSDNDTTYSLNWDTDNPNSMFEYMGETSFATFYNFSNLTSEYRVDHSEDPNFGLRYKGSTDGGVNYSINYYNHEDANPYVGVHWEDQTGAELTTAYVSVTPTGGVDGNCGTKACTSEKTTTIQLQKNGTAFSPYDGNTANLVFTEKTNRVQSLGAALDMAVDGLGAPVVFRGEFLYDKDVMTPIVDRAALAIGDVTGALTNEKADFFKYVLGADVTVMTNLMLSGQFIQMRNLDYVDVMHRPSVDGVESHYTGARYTGDAATLHLTNGLQKAEKNKEFYSFFMSKPFGAEQQHRWNNIFMYEENGGKWDRFDVEYSFTDEMIGTAEYNKYWGDANTQFGQMEMSSNFQLGLKYIF